MEKLLKSSYDLKEFYKNKTQQLEKVTDELKSINENKNLFIGIVAHDLRNPLMRIYGGVELIKESLKQSDVQNAKIGDYIGQIQSASDIMNRLIKDLLDITMIESGNFRLHKTMVNIGDLIESNLGFYSGVAEKKNIRIVFKDETFEKIPEILLDREKIMEVIDNLIGNAIKYSFKKSKIIIQAKRINKYLKVEVIDEGKGLSSSDVKDLFKPFKIGTNTPTNGESSTGLGLAIVKKIIDLHGGEVGVDSKLDEGSKFYFILRIY